MGMWSTLLYVYIYYTVYTSDLILEKEIYDRSTILNYLKEKNCSIEKTENSIGIL